MIRRLCRNGKRTPDPSRLQRTGERHFSSALFCPPRFSSTSMRSRQSSALCLALLLSVAFALPSLTRAQTPDDGPTSVGFASPDSTQPIRDYRLPSWRWSRWTLDANGGSTYRESSLGRNPTRRERSGYAANLSLRPNYRSFWESETRRAHVRVSPSLSFNHSGDTASFPDSSSEHDRSRHCLKKDSLATPGFWFTNLTP